MTLLKLSNSLSEIHLEIGSAPAERAGHRKVGRFMHRVKRMTALVFCWTKPIWMGSEDIPLIYRGFTGQYYSKHAVLES